MLLAAWGSFGLDVEQDTGSRTKEKGHEKEEAE